MLIGSLDPAGDRLASQVLFLRCTMTEPGSPVSRFRAPFVTGFELEGKTCECCCGRTEQGILCGISRQNLAFGCKGFRQGILQIWIVSEFTGKKNELSGREYIMCRRCDDITHTSIRFVLTRSRSMAVIFCTDGRKNCSMSALQCS